MSIKVHIILPIYNGEQYILDQLFSLYHQEYINWKLYIIDDASSDKSVHIINKFINDNLLNDKIKIIHNKTNIWLNGSIEVWLKEILKCTWKNDLVGYCDADDIWCRNKLHLQVEFMKNHPLCDLCYHDLTLMDQDGIVTNTSYIQTLHRLDNNIYSNVFAEFCTWQHIPSISIIFRALYISELIPLPKDLPQDNWTALVFSYLKKNIGYIDMPLAYYRRHQQSMSLSTNINDQALPFVKMYKALDCLYEKHTDTKILYYRNYAVSRADRHRKRYSYIRQTLLIMVLYPRIFIVFLHKVHSYILHKIIRL